MGVTESKGSKSSAAGNKNEAPIPKNAKSIEDFGYEWVNVKPDEPKHEYYLQMLQKENGKPFEFKGQKHYEALGDMVTPAIYELMEKEFNMERFQVPLKEDVDEDYDGAFVPCFMTPNALESDRLMLIVQGSGQVRAGQWARSLCINKTLHEGSILPYLHRARERGYGIIVNNPNMNLYLDSQKKSRKIPHSSSPEEQLIYIWRKFVKESQAKDIVIIAHSYGGVATLTLRVLTFSTEAEVRERVRAIALTDSVHGSALGFIKMSSKAKKFWKTTACNWAKSEEPLDTDFGIRGGVPTVSAGHEKHEHTSYACMESVFDFIDSKLPPIESHATAASAASDPAEAESKSSTEPTANRNSHTKKKKQQKRKASAAEPSSPSSSRRSEERSRADSSASSAKRKANHHSNGNESDEGDADSAASSSASKRQKRSSSDAAAPEHSES